MKNRDIVNHGPGKGDANRSPLNKAWRDNYDAIKWYDPAEAAAGRKYVRRGRRLVKIYRS